jgi:hypothetical protein
VTDAWPVITRESVSVELGAARAMSTERSRMSLPLQPDGSAHEERSSEPKNEIENAHPYSSPVWTPNGPALGSANSSVFVAIIVPAPAEPRRLPDPQVA